MNNFRVSLIVSGLSYDPDKFTLKVGIKPSSVERIGDLTSGGKPKAFPSNAWELVSNSTSDEVDVHVFKLLKKLDSRLKGKKIDGKVHINVYADMTVNEDNPNMSLNSKTIALMSKFNCSIDYDLYLFSSKKK